MVRPKPRHAGHAPNGLLKLKSPGVGGRISRSQCAQCQPVEKGCILLCVFVRSTKLIWSFPKRRAVSIDSTSRGARFLADRQAILDDLNAGAEPDVSCVAVCPNDFAVQPDAQVALLLEEGEEIARLGLGGRTQKVMRKAHPQRIAE